MSYIPATFALTAGVANIFFFSNISSFELKVSALSYFMLKKLSVKKLYKTKM